MSAAPFCPFRYLARHWPEWSARFTQLHGFASEVFCSEQKLILIDPGEDGEEFSLTHSIQHLENGDYLTPNRVWTEQQEQDANDVAELWLLDGPAQLLIDHWAVDDIPADGEPSVTRR